MTPAEHYARYARLSQALDRAFRIPGTRWRFGLDAVFGLIPGVGDFVGALFGAYGVLVARGLGAPLSIQSRMLANVFADAVVGTIPVAGDLFDFAFKPHMRNLALMTRWQNDPDRVAHRSRLMLILVPATLLLVAALSIAAAIAGFLAITYWGATLVQGTQ